MSRNETNTDDETRRLLVIDDDETFNRVLSRALGQRGFAVSSARDGADALAQAIATEPEFVVLDLNLAGESGLKLIPSLLEASPGVRILVLTGYASIATAVDAVKLGASQYLAKPADISAIVLALTGDDAPTGELVSDEPMSVSRLEWEHIQRVLAEHDGNISACARALRMHRRTLQRKLAKRPAAL